MLHRTAEFAGAEVTRTRDPEKLAAMDIVVDVGAVYDPATHRYDHHQRGFDETMKELGRSVKLSSAGLVYRHWGKEVIAARLGLDTMVGQTQNAVFSKVRRNLLT